MDCKIKLIIFYSQIISKKNGKIYFLLSGLVFYSSFVFEINRKIMSPNVFTFNERNCTSCYSCVRKCPVKAIKVSQESIYPEVIPERCIGCGTCIKACSFNAIKVLDSIQTVKELINSNHKVAAICDPSIAGEFEDITDYRKFVKMIRNIGFDYVTEVAFGVDLVAKNQADLTNEKQVSTISLHIALL